jgi:hypothetical protein
MTACAIAGRRSPGTIRPVRGRPTVLIFAVLILAGLIALAYVLGYTFGRLLV